MRPTKPPPRVHDPEVYCASAGDTVDALRKNSEWYLRGSPAIGSAYIEASRLIANAVALEREAAKAKKEGKA